MLEILDIKFDIFASILETAVSMLEALTTVLKITPILGILVSVLDTLVSRLKMTVTCERERTQFPHVTDSCTMIIRKSRKL